MSLPECYYGSVDPDPLPDLTRIEERALRDNATALRETWEWAKEMRADMQRAGLDDSLFHDLANVLRGMVKKTKGVEG